MIAAGIGFRESSTAQDIVLVFQAALSQYDLRWTDIAILATLDSKASRKQAIEAANRLGVVLVGLPLASLQICKAHAVTISTRVEIELGLPSLAETAALAAVGNGGRLLGPRIANPMATCALAKGEEA